MMANASATIPSRQPPTASLADCIERGDHYTVIRSALAHLDKSHSHKPATLLAARSFIALGLVGPARELLSTLAQESSLSTQVREMTRCVDGMPSGRLAWGKLQPRFEANIQRLLEVQPGLRMHEEIFRSLPRRLELYKSVDGNVHVSRRPNGAKREWLPNLCDTKGVAQQVALGHAAGALSCNPYLLVGDRYGLLLQRVYESTKKMLLTFTPRVYVVEPDVELFGVTLYVADSMDPWCDERVELFVGPDGRDALVRHLETNPSRALPEYMLLDPSTIGPSTDRMSARFDAIAQSRGKRIQEKRAEIANTYAELPADHWQQRFRSGDSLRVLGLTSRFTTVLQYTMRDFGAAFEHLGHDFQLLIDDNDHDMLNPQRIVESIASFAPDLVLQIDHLGAEMSALLPSGIPSVCWIQDRLPNLFSKQAGQSVRPFEFVMGYGFPECITQFDYPADRFFPCVIPTSPRMISGSQERDEDLAPYRCDVMYASNFRRKPAGLLQEQRLRFSPADRKVLDAAYEMLTGVLAQPGFCGDYDYEGLVGRAEDESGIRATDAGVRTDIVATIGFLADAHIRQAMVRSVARWADETGGSFHLYGDGWSEHADFARFARGRVEHGAPLGRAFRGARISLHGGRNPALHQRVLDGLAAGGFFLIGAKPSDAAHPTNQAIHRFIQQHEANLPDRLRPSDLAEPHASFYAEFLRLRGNDPLEGVALTREMVLNVRAECEWKTRQSASSLWPEYERIVFRNDEELFERIDHYLRNEDERDRIRSDMQRAVMENFTYDALVQRLLKFIAHRLPSTEPRP